MVQLKGIIVLSPKVLEICARAYLRHKKDITRIYRCGILVLTSPHISLGKTSVCIAWVDVERASSVGFCLAQLTMNLGQDPLS